MAGGARRTRKTRRNSLIAIQVIDGSQRISLKTANHLVKDKKENETKRIFQRFKNKSNNCNKNTNISKKQC